MPHTDTGKPQATSKPQATNHKSCHASHRYQQITSIKSATNRTSYHASHRYQQITGNKYYILPCLTRIRSNQKQQKRTSCHASQGYQQQTVTIVHLAYLLCLHGYQQITGNKTYILPCRRQTPANHRQQILLLAMPHTDTSNKQATSRTSLPCLTQIPANHRQQIVHLTMPHTDTSKSQATNLLSCHASHRYLQITGNKSYILPCLTQVPATHRQQIVHLTMLPTDTRKSQAILPTNLTSCHASRCYQQITGNKSYILPCLTQIPANHKQPIANLAMPRTDTSKSQATNRTSYHASHGYQQIQATNLSSYHASHRCQQHTGKKSYILPCLTQKPANHRQQIVHLTMPQTDNKQQITGNKSYILPCVTQIPANHRQQIVHLTMPHTDTSKSQATNRTSCHASHRYLQITGSKSCFLPCFTQVPANHRQQIVLLAMPHTDTTKS